MIKSIITNDILKHITAIEENRLRVADIEMPAIEMNRLRKNSKRKSSYASNKIEGNPLTEIQSDEAIDSDPHKHFLKPEQEVRNYFSALSYLERELTKKTKVSTKMIMDVQAIVEKGASAEKIGFRGPMPPGMLFAVYDSQSSEAEYIPPEAADIPVLMYELENYIQTTDDYPLIMAAIVHYQLVTIHPFEDGNGRTARLISGYIMDLYGYGFRGIGSLEEYFAYDPDEYYESLQMGLPALYYSGRNDPPHPETWIDYFLRMVELYSSKVYEISKGTKENDVSVTLSGFGGRSRELLKYILEEKKTEYRPIDIAKELGVTNRTIINRTAELVLVKEGFVIPVLVRERVTAYRISDYTKAYKNEIMKLLN